VTASIILHGAGRECGQIGGKNVDKGKREKSSFL
jgi:hypothetical protein